VAAVGLRFRYIGRRLLQTIPMIFLVIVLNFLLLQLAPGDAADVLAGEAASATPEYMAMIRSKFGLDQPLRVQLLKYLQNIVVLDLGYSFRHDMPVLDLILARLGPTLLLMLPTVALAITAGSLLGLLAARRAGRPSDSLITVVSLVSYATPLFWVGLMLILVFSLRLGWFPTSGMETIGAFHEGWRRVLDIARHMVLPVVTLSLFYLALYTRLMRASVLEHARMDYVRTARAKGLAEGRIVFKHVVRNAILPVVTMAGVQFSSLLGGSVVVETVFGWPGLGTLIFESVFARDVNLLLGIFLLSAVLVMAINLLVDLLYSFLDPRIEVR
jgi:peptide/nickel transport system permease protein